MRSIQLKNITKVYQKETILEGLNLTIPEGKFFALLGPSGSGKTTILRLIAGFETADSGNIFLGDEDITQKPINQRKVNTVFQNYALFPHMTVFENVAYGLVVKHVDKATIEDKVMKVLKSVDLESQAHKSIKNLSGGQQQRVALARAIINEPEVLLLDEPLAALDLRLREKLLVELIELQDKLKTTFIYVTHDPSEALTVADQMAILNHDGIIEQIGTPKEIYEFPQSSFVAQFVGNTNIFHGMYSEENGESAITIPQLGTFSVFITRKKEWMIPGNSVVLSVRPEKFFITKKEVTGFSNMLKGTVEAIIYHGRSTQYNIRLANNQIIQVFEQNEEHFPHQVIDYDNELYLYWQKENAVMVER